MWPHVAKIQKTAGDSGPSIQGQIRSHRHLIISGKQKFRHQFIPPVLFVSLEAHIDSFGGMDFGLNKRGPNGPFLGAKILINANFFVQSFSTTLRVMDVRAETRGRPHQKLCFPAAPLVGRKFLPWGIRA